MKKINALFAAVLMLLPLLLTACSPSPRLDPNDPVTLTIWHVYGSQTTSPLNDAIYEFNSTVGNEKGIIIKVEMVTDSAKIDDALNAALGEEPGAQELPDLFVAYPRMAEKFADGKLLDFKEYFTEDELEEYREDFLSEGYFGGKLLMLPIAKSSELIFLNKTIFDRFSADSGITVKCFESIEGITDACKAYYDWSDGKAMFQINDFYHYFLSNIQSVGGEFIKDGKINADSDEFEKAFRPIAEAGIYGGLCLGDGYASDRWKTAEIICNSGSTAGILYLRDYVTYEDNTKEDIETLVLPYACLKGGERTVVQRGGGLFAVRNEDERKNEAAAVFAKWIAEAEHNMKFVTEAGYLPVTDGGFEKLISGTVTVENEKYRMLYNAVGDQYKDGCRFCSVPLYEGASGAQKDFETLIKSVLSACHEQYTERVAGGEDSNAVMNELTEAALSSVKNALK